MPRRHAKIGFPYLKITLTDYFFLLVIFYISLLRPFGNNISPKSEVGMECYAFLKRSFAPGLLRGFILSSLIWNVTFAIKEHSHVFLTIILLHRFLFCFSIIWFRKIYEVRATRTDTISWESLQGFTKEKSPAVDHMIGALLGVLAFPVTVGQQARRTMTKKWQKFQAGS